MNELRCKKCSCTELNHRKPQPVIGRSRTDVMKHHDQAVEDEAKWHLGNHPYSDEQIRAFRAGFQHGWRAALCDLILNDNLQFTEAS